MPTKHETMFFTGLLLLSAALLFFLFLPFLNVIVLAFTFYILFRPVFREFVKIFRKHEGLASFLIVLLAAMVIIGPLTYFSFQIFGEAQGLYLRLSSGAPGPTIEFFRGKFAGLGIDIDQYARQLLDLFLNNLGTIFSKVAALGGTFFLALFALYYLLRDGEKLTDAIIRISPLSRARTEEVLAKLSLMADSAIRGTLMMSAIQGLLVGLGFFIFGIPSPILWGTVTVFAALIPIFGTALVVLPAVADLAFTGSPVRALGLAIWGLAFVGLIDNFLRPILIKKGTKIHTLLVLMSVLGGIEIFGAMGFLLGPLILSLFLALIELEPSIFGTSEAAK